MLLVEGIRKKLLTQRRDLFRQVAQTEEELLWFQSDIESEVEERGQEETMVRLLDRLDGRAKAEIEAIDWGQSSTANVSDAVRLFPSPGWR
jgi:RNA polymerase-binding transcription factor DksA